MVVEQSFLPSLSNSSLAFIRTVYGCLLLILLTHASIHWRRFFVSGRTGGYFDPAEGFEEKLHSVNGARLVLCAWFLSAVCLVCDFYTPFAAALNLVFCRHFFVSTRWKSIARGFGAPGFMTYWLSLWLFLLEITCRFASPCKSLVLLASQLDFSLIMLSAGTYKLLSGYAKDHGMEYGMVNPQWGYFPYFFQKFRTTSVLFKFLNHMAWSTEVVAGILMLIPSMRLVGSFLIFASFLFIATQIRLGILCEIVMTCCLLFIPANSFLDRIICSAVPYAVTPAACPDLVITLISLALFGYMVITPLVHFSLFFNLFARKRLPGILQRMVDAYANTFGIIVWRVFSADLTNFYINVYSLDLSGRQLISKYSYLDGVRFSYVCEAITITSLFTLRKYYPSDLSLFEERLLRYASTLPSCSSQVFEFEYVSLRKEESLFVYRPISSYTVDLKLRQVKERILDETISVTTRNACSPLYAGPKAGSYAPVR